MERILIVEDDDALVRGIEFALAREGWAVKSAGTVSDAWTAYNAEKFDLILLDVMLPDGNGFDFCKKVRDKSEVPVIFLTACDEEINVVLGLDIGADDYITKPFRLRELISRIRAALRRGYANAGAKTEGKIIRSGDIELNLLDRRLLKSNAEILLTPTEYKLTAVLMQNALQTLSREQILQKLWDIEGEFIDDNTLSVHIRRLREKIEDNSSDPAYIVTVRGFGYKWNQRCC
jgi:DNA-binding response OmpR family regulator